MASELLPDKLWREVAPLPCLHTRSTRRAAGTSPTTGFASGIVFALKTGIA